MDTQAQQVPQTPNHLVATINVNELLPPGAPRKIKSAPSRITSYHKSTACKKLDFSS